MSSGLKAPSKRRRASATTKSAKGKRANRLDSSVKLQQRSLQTIREQQNTIEVLARQASIVECADDAIVGRNLKDVITSWNHGATRMYGYQPGEILGKPFALLVPANRPNELRLIRSKIRASEAIHHHETVRVTKDGRLISVSQSNFPIRDRLGRVIGIATIARNITAQKQAESAFRQSEQRLRDLFNHAPLGIILTDDRGAVWQINAQLLALLGGDLQHCIGRSLAEFFANPVEWEPLFTQLQQARLVQARTWLRRLNGSTLPVMIEGARASADSGHHSHWFVRDLSHRAKLEAEVINIGDRECRRISHDLHDEICQELTGVEFLCQAFKQQLKARALPERDLQDLEEIAGMVRHAIGKTRELARGLSPTGPTPDGLMQALQQLAELTTRRYRIHCHFHCPTPVRIADQTTNNHLFRIAQEAVHNALRHGKARRIAILLRCQNRRLSLRIKDNGVGMTVGRATGAGMGLQIMQYRASLIRGAWRIHSQHGLGTTVACSLMLEANPAPQPPYAA